MPSDSIAGFLEHAQASRVLFPEQVEQLIRQPDIPQSDLASLCDYLLSRGVLTRFQANALRDGRGEELSFAGYPVLDELGPCRGGTAYQALHPSLRTPVVIWKLDPGGFSPTDTAAAVVGRARSLGTIVHPNLLALLDAGFDQGQPYAVLDQLADSVDVAVMLREVGGAMPGFLAAEYAWSVASALRAIHERGGWHGEVRPGLLLIGPIVTKSNPDGSLRRRPAPHAVVKLTETGLVPISPPAAQSPPPIDVLTYLPPERIDSSDFGPRGDTYGLGATLYLLLAGRPPFTADSSQELLEKVRSAEPTSLTALRPDIPPELAALVMRMMARRPEDRPPTSFDVCQELATFCRPGTLPQVPQVIPVPAMPMAVTMPPTSADPIPEAVPVPTEADAWGVSDNAFASAQAASQADTTQKRRRSLTEKDRSRSKLWIALGLCLHLTAVGMIVGYMVGAFDGLFKSTPVEKKDEPPPSKHTPKLKRGQKAKQWNIEG